MLLSTVYNLSCKLDAITAFVSFSLQVNLQFFCDIFHSTTPTHAFTQILILITPANPGRQRSLETALFWGIWLTVISTAINPFIYGLLARQYRMAYIYVFRLWFSKCCGFCVDPPLKDVFGEFAGAPPPTFPRTLTIKLNQDT